MTGVNIDLEKDVLAALHTVSDPEIDTVSIVDLGIVEDVSFEGDNVSITLLPTFLGCPALDIIKKNVEIAVGNIQEINSVKVSFIKNPPWTSDRITEAGKEGLKEFGIAPPPKQLESDGSWSVDCPYCGSAYNTLENIFGPSACRSILYCKSCKNPFEAMKPISTM